MKRYILAIILMAASYKGFTQELTIPQVVGVPTGTQMTVSFPFGIEGVPFSEIPGAVWPNKASAMIKAEVTMSYYMEGDEKRYGNKVTFSVNIRNGGTWKMSGLFIQPKPYHIPGKKMVEGKTHYRLVVYQAYNGKKSYLWYTTINRVNPSVTPNIALDQKPATHVTPLQQPVVDKIPDQNKGPIKVLPKDKVILNPQPIPPNTGKKLIRSKGL